MLAKLHHVYTALCMLALGAALSACGGGGSAASSTAPPAPTLTLDYKYIGLVGSPSFTISSTTFSNASAGTVTLASGGVSDAVGYTLDTTSGLMTPTLPYTALGDLSKGWLMVCKPLGDVDGNVTILDTGPKSIYAAMPNNAVAGTTADVSGKTFDFHENCKTTKNLQFSAALLNTSATIALFSPDGFVQRSGTLPNITTDTDRLAVYTVPGGKVFLVSRTVKTPPNENTWGAIGLWVSR